MSCSVDSDCFKSTCYEDKCVCLSLYFGDHCESYLGDQNVSTFDIVFYVYSGITIFLFVLLAIANLYIFVAYVRSGRKLKKLSPIAMLICFCTVILRILYFCIDPYNIHAIYARVGDQFFFTVPLIFIAAAGSMVSYFWVKVLLKSGMSGFSPLKIFLKVIIGVFVAIMVLLIVSIVWRSFQPSLVPYYIFNLTVAFYVLYYMISTLIVGLRIRSVVKSIALQSGELTHVFHSSVSFLKRITRFVIITSVSFGFSFATTIIFIAANPQYIAWIIVQLLFRIYEVVIIGSLLMCLFVGTFKQQKQTTPLQNSSSILQTPSYVSSNSPTLGQSRTKSESNSKHTEPLSKQKTAQSQTAVNPENTHTSENNREEELASSSKKSTEIPTSTNNEEIEKEKEKEIQLVEEKAVQVNEE